MLSDTLRVAESLHDVTIFFTPDEADDEIASFCAATMPRVPQGGGDLGRRMLAALQHLLATRQYDAGLLVGSDVPLIGAEHLTDATETLQATGGVVLGPADDGGYYLIGMVQVHAGLFEPIAWGTGSVLTDTLRAAERIGVEARLVRSAYDVDTIDDLRRLERDLSSAPAGVCPDVRRWFRIGAE